MAILNMDLYSYELAMNTQVTMILPERRGVPHAPYDGQYPVLYLLHGHGQDYTSWLRLTRIEFYLQNSDVIVVMPNGNRSSYVDGVNTHCYGSYITKELPQALKNWFNMTSQRDKTFIAGMSMGGYGALRAALAHPELYGAACALSPCIRMVADDLKGGADKGLAIPDNPEIGQNFYNTFGPDETYYGSKYDLKHLAKTLNDSNGLKPHILQICGKDDPLCGQGVEFAGFMEKECPDIDYRCLVEPGMHDFNFWDKESITMLQFFGLIPGTAQE